MTTQTAEMTNTTTIQSLMRGIAALSDESIKKLADYIDDLIDEQTEADDIAYIEAHKDDPTFPLSEIIKDYEPRHGAFRRI